MSIADVYDGS